MPLIKTITSGETVKVVTKDGKPSCTCCNACSCSEDLPDTYTIDLDFFPFTVIGAVTVTRESSCVWRWVSVELSDVTLKCLSDGWNLQWESEGSTGPWYQDTPTPDDPTGIYGGGEGVVS